MRQPEFSDPNVTPAQPRPTLRPGQPAGALFGGWGPRPQGGWRPGAPQGGR